MAFRFIQRLDNATVVLSGMSDMDQMKENVELFKELNPLGDAETEKLLAAAEKLKDVVPCTACRYCCDGCPVGLDIPRLLGAYNDFKFDPLLELPC